MTYPAMLHMPLVSAYLCPDCNSIGNCAEQCPACASTTLMRLADVLDRRTVEQPQARQEFAHVVPMAA